MDSAGNLYILTELDSQIHVFTPDGKPVTSWAVAGADGKPLIEGSALLFENGRLLALDAASASLMAYDLTGKSLGKTRLCDCFYPRAVAPAQGGGYWVADTGAGRVLKVNATGATTLTVGAKGSGPGQFVEPAGVAQGSDGTLYVADVGNSRVQSFTPEGKPVAQWAVGASIARDGVRLARPRRCAGGANRGASHRALRRAGP